MLVFGYPTTQQAERKKPERVALKHLVHENRYRNMDKSELEEMWTPRFVEGMYEAQMKAFCERKFNSDFSREMSRSVAKYLNQFK